MRIHYPYPTQERDGRRFIDAAVPTLARSITCEFCDLLTSTSSHLLPTTRYKSSTSPTTETVCYPSDIGVGSSLPCNASDGVCRGYQSAIRARYLFSGGGLGQCVSCAEVECVRQDLGFASTPLRISTFYNQQPSMTLIGRSGTSAPT